MTYRMLIADLDGTVLNGEKRISGANIAALRHVTESGARVVFCTGRMICAARSYWEEVQPGTPLIGYNGALIKHPADGTTIFEKGLDPALTREAIDTCKQMHGEVFAYHNDTMFVEKRTPHLERYASTYRVGFELVPDLAKAMKSGATKLLMPCEPSEIAELIALTKERFEGRCNVTATEGRHVELLALGVSKYSASAFIAKHYGVKREEIAAVGDGINDIEMLQYAGLAVAVANAAPELKAIAQMIVASNEQNGVADLINKLEWGGTRTKESF